jgi:hypothetical protein
MSFTNVLNRGNFRWPYDGIYVDEDGTLGNVPGQTLISPDGLWNGSSLCTPTPNFLNALSCPTSLGSWLRFAFDQCSLSQDGQWLFVYDSANNVAMLPYLHHELTHPNGYAMALLAKRTYTLQFENANVTFFLVRRCSNSVFYFLELCQFVIFRYCLQFGSRRLSDYSSSN